MPRSLENSHHHRLPPLLLVAVLLGAGCAAPPPPQTGAPVGYEALRENISPDDFGPLVGRRILLDPGHGGFYAGARADNGLTEAEINLGVALHLRGLLEWAGAEVYMTRTADTDFLAGTDSTLAADLSFRVSMADSLKPEVFLSLHHNSNAARNPLLNETQTYYPLGDDGASLDLARAIHRHLAVNLDIRPARLLPGNFHVLRNSPVPAVLGEPAMISHPGVAERLTLARARQLEAEAYFLGLLEYFAGGDPVWAAAQPETVVVGPTGTTLSWTFVASRAGTPAAPGPDAASFRVTAAGHEVAADLDVNGGALHWQAPPLSDGAPLRIEVRGSNLAGRALPVAHTLLLPASGRRLDVKVVSDEAGAALVSWRTPGAEPLPRGYLVWDDGRRITVEPGLAADILLDPAPDKTPIFVPAHAGVPDVTVLWSADVLPAPWYWQEVADPPPTGGWRARTGDVFNSPPPAGRTAVPMSTTRAWWSAPGRRPVLARLPDAHPAYTDPVVPVLEGLTVVVDPAGGNADPDGTGPTGVTGASVNRGTARELVRLLTAAGARAILTTNAPTTPDPMAKVALSQRVGADLFLTIGRGSSDIPARILHHPGSHRGEPWAHFTAASLTTLLNDSTTVALSWNYLLRHTACPALEIRLPHATTLDDERRLETRSWQAAEARALLLGLARSLAAPDMLPALDLHALLANLPHTPSASEIGWAFWDGELPWYPMVFDGVGTADTLASWHEPGLPAQGPLHTLEIHAGESWQLWLIRTDGHRPRGELIFAGGDPGRSIPTP